MSLALILACLAACARPALKGQACARRDWYEVGRQDGAQGAAEDQVGAYAPECGGPLGEHDQLVYQNGRHAGLVGYCRPASAFQTGRAGHPYRGVCPPTIEPAFLADFGRGRRAREVEGRGRDLDVEIERVASRLRLTTDSGDQRRLRAQLAVLRRARRRTERELERVTR